MWLTALMMGFAGSLHCLGMCSPLAMAVTNLSPSALMNRLIYNTGRIITYGVLGGVVSSIGFVLPILKVQNLISILLGLAMLLIGVGVLKIHIPGLSSLTSKVTFGLKNLFSKFLTRKSYGSILLLGTFNGLLPCGLVMIALTYCLTLPSSLDGFIFMLFFGAGTLPVMVGITSLIPRFIARFNFNIKWVTNGMLVLSGILLIVRVFIVHLPHKDSLHQGVIDIVLCQ